MLSALLSDSPVTTILPVKDMERARDFYERKLGFRPEGPKPDGKFVYRCASGAIIALFPKEGGTKADHTALSFEVRDIKEAIRTLEQAGVVFEDYDFPGLKTERVAGVRRTATSPSTPAAPRPAPPSCRPPTGRRY